MVDTRFRTLISYRRWLETLQQIGLFRGLPGHMGILVTYRFLPGSIGLVQIEE